MTDHAEIAHATTVGTRGGRDYAARTGADFASTQSLYRKIRVFIASPGDVADARERADVVIAELSKVLGDAYKVVVEAVMWEHDAWPGFGEDAQDVINEQIGDFDVFVAILWTRLGTPTGRATSGTVEEYGRAYERWRQTRKPAMMLYFCKAPAALEKVEEIRQKEALIEFRDAVQAHGLTWDFESADDFERKFRNHLRKELERLIGGFGGAAGRDAAQDETSARPHLDRGAEAESVAVQRERLETLRTQHKRIEMHVNAYVHADDTVDACKAALAAIPEHPNMPDWLNFRDDRLPGLRRLLGELGGRLPGGLDETALRHLADADALVQRVRAGDLADTANASVALEDHVVEIRKYADSMCEQCKREANTALQEVDRCLAAIFQAVPPDQGSGQARLDKSETARLADQSAGLSKAQPPRGFAQWHTASSPRDAPNQQATKEKM